MFGAFGFNGNCAGYAAGSPIHHIGGLGNALVAVSVGLSPEAENLPRNWSARAD